MKAQEKHYDVIIVGGSYSGLAAAMALGRAMKHVLIIDSGKPCNSQTPYAHNFITHDGKTPREISAIAKRQVERYDTIKFFDGLATKGARTDAGCELHTATGEVFHTKKIVFATGIVDVMPDLAGFAECWGISVLHCPYCHGYEVRNKMTGILGNGEYGFEFANLISNWTKDLTLYTNGKVTLTTEQTTKIENHGIKIVESEVERLMHTNGHVQEILFKDGSGAKIEALYARCHFEQHSTIPQMLGCELTDDGYVKVDALQRTNVHGIFASGDNTSRVRTVANAVAMGTTAGMMVNKEIVFEEF